MSWIERTFYATIVDADGSPLILESLTSSANTQAMTVIRQAIREGYQERATEMQVNILTQRTRYIVPFRYRPSPSAGGSMIIFANRPITLDARPYTLRIVEGPPLTMSRPQQIPSSVEVSSTGPPQTPPLTGSQSILGPMTGRDLRSTFSFSGRNIRPSILRTPTMSSSNLRAPASGPLSSSSSPDGSQQTQLYVEGSDDEEESKEADDAALPPLSDPTHTLSDERIEDGEYSGEVHDMLMASDVSVKDYLKEDPDNVIIIVDDKRAVGYPRSKLRAQYQDKSAIRYECHVSGAAIFEIRPTDVDFDRPYYRLSVPEPYLIPVVMMIPLLEYTHRIWRLKKGTRASLPFTASRSVIASRRTDSRGNTLNMDGQRVYLSSASHCGPGTDAPVMDLHAVRLPASVTGGRRRRTVRRQHHKHKKVPPTRRRKVRPTRK
jgi:hypothetical protein